MSCIKSVVFFCILIFAIIVRNGLAKLGNHEFVFNKVLCEVYDESYVDFPYCNLKAIKRDLKQISLKVNLKRLPLNNLAVRFQLMYKTTVYKPFLYNIRVDVCSYFKRPFNPLAKLVFSFLEGFSNLNHTCPINHHLLLTNLTNTHVNKCLKGLPFATGEYALYTLWDMDNKTVTGVKVFGTVASAD